MKLGYGLGMTYRGRGGDAPELTLIEQMQALSSGVRIWAPDDGAVFEDTAGTTPTSLTGPVGRLNDLGSSGSNLLQATAGRRPILTDIGGNRALVFNASLSHFLSVAMDLTASDRVLVVAALRTGTVTGAANVFVEFSTSTVTQDGSFVLYAVSSGSSLGFGARGSTRVNATATPLPSATTDIVLSGTADISDDAVELFRDGSSVGSASSDLGTGNFGSHDLFVNARAGTSLFANASLFALVIDPLNATGMRALAEQYCAEKAGVTL